MRKYRYGLSAFLMAVMMLVSACGKTGNTSNKEDPLLFLWGTVTMEGVLEIGEKEYGIIFKINDGKSAKVTFTAPPTMEGYVFEKAEDGYFVSYGDLRIPLRQSTMPGGAGSLLNLLDCLPSNVQKSTEKANGMEMTVYTLSSQGTGTVKVYLKKE